MNNRFMIRPLAILLGFFVIVVMQSGHAQPLYSLNAVGYVDVNLYPGSNLVANPLNAASNTVGFLFGRVPDGSAFLPWNQAAGIFGPTNHYSTLTGWTDPEAVFVQPNAGFLVVPSATKISFHGEAWSFARGPYCLTYPANESYWGWFPSDICGICEPVACPPFGDSTVVSTWDAVFQVFSDYVYFEGFGWVPSDPIVGPGFGFRLANPRVAFGRSPFLRTLGDGPLVHGRPSTRLQEVQRSGTNLTFRLAASADAGYSILRTTNLDSDVWQIQEQGSNGPINFSLPATGPRAFFKLHPRYFGPAPFLISRARAGSFFSFDFFAPSNTVYTVERANKLWEAPSLVITNVPAAANTLVTIVDRAATNAIGYYRVSY
jgi:hypothetical protein